MTVISVIVGSTREGRFSEKPAKWILQHLKKRNGVDARLLDLRDFPMPFFDEPVPPATPGRPPYKNEVVQRWTAAIAQSDGFVFVTPEYNYGPSAVLKNAIDWVYPEWNRKAAGFVSYGSAMGARGVQQLRLTAIEVQLAPISLLGPHPCVNPVGSLSRRRCRCRAGGARGARWGYDRRSAVVDCSLEDGARGRVAGR
jgi:NAD(P)H-dependent FMN reductase